MSGMTRSMPNISSSGNISPQSMTTISSPYSNTYMFLPISPTPPSGMMRSGWSLVGGIRFLGLVVWYEGGEWGGRLVGRRRHGHGGLIEAFKVFKGVEVGRDRGRGVGAG